jgi:type IV pilus assembly protein PilY1
MKTPKRHYRNAAMTAKWIRRTLVGALLAIGSTGQAEDIDLFIGVDTSADIPNVLIVLDNSANWSSDLKVPDCYFVDGEITTTSGPKFESPGMEQGTKMGIEKCALYNVINALTVNADDGSAKFNLGLMLLNESPNSGGYPRQAFLALTAENKELFKKLIASIKIGDDKGNNADFSLALYEAFLYFTSSTPENGTKGTKWDGAAVSGTKYVAPETDSCAGNHIILIGNGSPQGGENDAAKSLLGAAGGNTTKITYPTSVVTKSDQDNWVDEYARFLRTLDLNPDLFGRQNITTHTVAVTGAASDGLFPNLMRGVAIQGGGSFYEANSVETLVDALLDAFNQIQAENSVFASASLPVSVNTQGVYRNQVFIGMFRPDGDTRPRWDGNLKQYQFRLFDDGSLKLADKEGDTAINATTGFIAPCAVSFWTPDATSTDTYWKFRSDLGAYENPCTTVAGAAASNTPDGDIVEKGAAGYRLRGTTPGARKVLTCSGDCTGSSALPLFNTANTAITTSALAAADSANRDDIINWVRGQDLRDEDGDTNTSEMRPSVHGDVVHARPLAVDYGDSIGVVVFYGGNDGALRALDGNKDDADGTEYWAFVAPEHYGKLKRLYDNEPRISYPGISATGTARKDYFFDGPISGYRSDSTVWIYATMRRGGRMVYAFDVSDPASPTIKWRQGCPNVDNDTGCTDGFAGIGQTWSEARLLNAGGYLDDSVVTAAKPPKPLIIIGGGYDSCEDAEPHTCSSTSKGGEIYVLDADTGTLLNTLPTERSVAADVTVVDADGNRLADYAYAVDTGGNIYRIDIGVAAPASWTITRIASLGCDGGECADGEANRKFLHAPEVVATSAYNAVLVGSGDREHPLFENEATNIANAFFMVKDVPLSATWLTDEETACGGPFICTDSLLPIDPDGADPSFADLQARKGWYLSFGAGNHVGEQVVTSAVVVGGVTYFSTHAPTSATACTANLGTARGYSVRFSNAHTPVGTARYDIFPGGGLPPSPVAGVVEVDKPGGDGSVRLPFVIGGRQPEGESSPLETQNPDINVLPDRRRTHWFIQQ